MDLGGLIRTAVGPLSVPGTEDRPAISLEDVETWTYRELNDRVNTYANALVDLGVGRGDRVGLLLYNSLEYVGLYFAITRIGAIAVRLNWRLVGDELHYAIDDSGCSMLCVHDDLMEGVVPLRDRLPTSTYVVVPYEGGATPDWGIPHDSLLDSPGSEPDVPTPAAEEPAMIMYTSGTTGRPKGAVWTHGNSTAFAAMQQSLFGLGHDTIALTTGPLFHVGSFEDVHLGTFLVRGHAVLTRSKAFRIERTIALIEQMKATDTLLQPVMIYDLLRSPAFSTDALRSLRRIMTGGTAIHEWALEQLRTDLPDVDVYSLYGLTEGGAISTALRLPAKGQKGNCVGAPLPRTEVRVVDASGTDAPAGEDGEVWVRSASSSRGYWNKPEANADTFIDGWCRTGDQGRLVDGLLTITGRIKDMIKSGGENIYPVEVESVLIEHPDVLDVSVVGVPDPVYQEAVCAVVVLRDDASASVQELVDFCRSRVASYKKPRHVVFVKQLPRNASGKVQKHILRGQMEATVMHTT